jgi:hypothetical protein
MFGLNTTGTALFCLWLVVCFILGGTVGAISTGALIATIIFCFIAGWVIGGLLATHFARDDRYRDR